MALLCLVRMRYIAEFALNGWLVSDALWFLWFLIAMVKTFLPYFSSSFSSLYIPLPYLPCICFMSCPPFCSPFSSLSLFVCLCCSLFSSLFMSFPISYFWSCFVFLNPSSSFFHSCFVSLFHPFSFFVFLQHPIRFIFSPFLKFSLASHFSVSHQLFLPFYLATSPYFMLFSLCPLLLLCIYLPSFPYIYVSTSLITFKSFSLFLSLLLHPSSRLSALLSSPLTFSSFFAFIHISLPSCLLLCSPSVFVLSVLAYSAGSTPAMPIILTEEKEKE